MMYSYLAKLEYNDKTKEQIQIAREWGKALGVYGFTVTPRGSGSRAPANRKDGLDLRHYDQSLPLKYAETVRIYVKTKKQAKYIILKENYEKVQNPYIKV